VSGRPGRNIRTCSAAIQFAINGQSRQRRPEATPSVFIRSPPKSFSLFKIHCFCTFLRTQNRPLKNLAPARYAAYCRTVVAIRFVFICLSLASGKRAISRPLFPPIFMPFRIFLPNCRTSCAPKIDHQNNFISRPAKDFGHDPLLFLIDTRSQFGYSVRVI
jgi:hypothetical protein